jgi:hypothetical protein
MITIRLKDHQLPHTDYETCKTTLWRTFQAELTAGQETQHAAGAVELTGCQVTWDDAMDVREEGRPIVDPQKHRQDILAYCKDYGFEGA